MNSWLLLSGAGLRSQHPLYNWPLSGQVSLDVVVIQYLLPVLKHFAT